MAVPTSMDQVIDRRPCTCHPDDNPPVPCEKRYALNECNVASNRRGRSPLVGHDTSLGEPLATLNAITELRELKWHRRFLELAKHISTWSKDPSTKVGAVLVDDQNHVVATGYNGFPAGCNDDPNIYADRAAKYKRVVHAEVNAILIAGHRARGCKLYTYPSFANPNICCECCKVAIQQGIRAVVGYEAANGIRKDWEESLTAARIMLCEAGVDTIIVKP